MTMIMTYPALPVDPVTPVLPVMPVLPVPPALYRKGRGIGRVIEGQGEAIDTV